MKTLTLVAALVLATTTASIREAAACGSTGQAAPQIRFADPWASFPGAKATGVWPRLERDGGRTMLALSYPRFGEEGPQLYMDRFEVVRDRNLRRLEHVLAHRTWPNLDVTIERVDGHAWRVVSWSTRA